MCAKGERADLPIETLSGQGERREITNAKVPVGNCVGPHCNFISLLEWPQSSPMKTGAFRPSGGYGDRTNATAHQPTNPRDHPEITVPWVRHL